MTIQKIVNWFKNKFGSKYVDFTGVWISWFKPYFFTMATPIQNISAQQLIDIKFSNNYSELGKRINDVIRENNLKIVNDNLNKYQEDTKWIKNF